MSDRALSQHIHASSLRERWVKGLGAGLLGQAINAASRIVLIPLFLRAWGAEGYGDWLILSSFVAYLSLVELGGQVYIVNLLTHAAARDEVERFREILHTGLALFLIVPFIGLALFMMALYWAPVDRWFNLTTTHGQVIWWVMLLLGLQVAVAIPQGLLTGVYRAIGLLPRGSMFNNAFSFLQLLFVGIGLWFKLSIVAIALLHLLPYLIVTSVTLRDLRKHLPPEMLLPRHVKLGMAAEFLWPSLHFFSIQVSQAISIQGVILIVGWMLGSVQVAIFGATRTLVNVAKQLLGLFSHTAWPDLTRAEAAGELEYLRILGTVVLRTTMLAACGGALVLHMWGLQLVEIWLGDRLQLSQFLIDLFLLVMLASVFWTACGNILMAVNRHHALSRVVLAYSILSVFLAYLFGLRSGLAGVVGGLLAAELLLPFWCVPYLVGRTLPVFRQAFFLREAMLLILLVGAAAWSFWAAMPVILLQVFLLMRGISRLRAYRTGFLKENR